MTIDILEGKESRLEEIIKNAVTENTEHGEVRVAAIDDLVWMKRQRGSKQDLAEIEALSNVKD
jgi:hypothetical protein